MRLIFLASIMFFSTETPCSFAARGPDTQTQLPINANTVLVFENVDLNICSGYNSTTGNDTSSSVVGSPATRRLECKF